MPHLHLQLFDQLRQWITPADQRHLSRFAEIMAAILLSQSACLSRWIPNLSHRDCSAQSHLERLSYFVHNPRITASIFYEPMLRHVLEPLSGSALELTLDTSVLWDKFCLIEVCLVWGGRSITLSQVVLEHGSATVGFEHYRPVLEQALALIRPDVPSASWPTEDSYTMTLFSGPTPSTGHGRCAVRSIPPLPWPLDGLNRLKHFVHPPAKPCWFLASRFSTTFPPI